MSLYDNASLVMIPSGVKEDKLYSVKPTDGSGDFTFSRGSDIQATRVNSSGLIEKAKVNLLLQSNSFDTTWTNASTTETSGQAGYDGTNDAWLLSKTAASGRIQQSITTSGVQTYSVYAKAGTLNFMLLMATTSSGDRTAYFDLSGSGAVGSGTNIDANIVSIGSGWYRCSVTFSESTTGVRIYPADADNDVSGTSGNIVIQDAQLNHGLIAQDYVETTTTAVVEGLTADLPRLDYSGGASCPSLLLEPSRTNVITSSEYLGSYSVSNVSVSYNNATSPEGVQNATLVTGDSGTLTKVVNLNPASNGAYTISVFAKYDSHQWIQLGMGGVATYANFDIQNGVVGGTNGTSDIEDYGNGWYRCSVQTTTGTPLSHYIGMVDSSSAARLATSTSTNSFWAYGMQSEIGSYPTSYIPTYSAAANRGVDESLVSSITSLIGQSEGTLFYEFDIQNLSGQDNNPIIITAKDSGGTDNIYIQTRADGGVRGIYYAGGSVQGFTNSGSGYLSDGNHKIAFGYKENDFVLYIDGVQVDTDTSGATSGSFDECYLGYYNNSFNPSINSKQTLLFKTRLTNAELAALTTL